MSPLHRTLFYGFPRTWLGRAVGGLLAAALVVSAFFFLFFFALVAGVLVMSLRLLWIGRKAKIRATRDVLDGEYSVEPRDEHTDITHRQ